MPFEENTESLAELRLTIYKQLRIPPSASREELWARNRADSWTQSRCTNCVAAGVDCKPLATKLRCGFCNSRERIAKCGTRCSFWDDELYDRVRSKSRPHWVPRETFNKTLKDILGELIDIDLVPSGSIISGDLLKAAVESAKRLREAESAIAEAKIEKVKMNTIQDRLRSKVEALEGGNNRILDVDRTHAGESEGESERMNATIKDLQSDKEKLLTTTKAKDETIGKLNNTIIHTQKLRNHWEQKYRSLSENLNEQRKNDLVKFIHLSGQHLLLSQALEGNSHETLRQAVKKSVEELTATSVRYHPGGLNFEEIETVLSSTPDKRLSLSKRQRTDGDSEIPASKRPASKCLTKDSLPSGSRPKVQQSGDKSVNKT